MFDGINEYDSEVWLQKRVPAPDENFIWQNSCDIELEKWNVRIEASCDSPKGWGTNYEISDEYRKYFYAAGLRLVRCRRCPACLRWRQRIWVHRCSVEYVCSPRTWWTTLTYRGVVEPTYEDVKKFFKRLRKMKQCTLLRYAISEETGEQNGRLHWHILIHCNDQVTRRVVDGCWPLGHCHSRLARSAGLGGYLAKYLAKQSRIRASQHYGDSYKAAMRAYPARCEAIEGAIERGDLSEIQRLGFQLNKYRPSGLEVTLSQFKVWDGLVPF